ncbi:MAG: transglutaminase domain-containing protein [Phycisphaerales bacterium JB063]
MLIGALLGALGVLLIAQAWLVALLRRAGVWARPMRIPALSAARPAQPVPRPAMRSRVTATIEATTQHHLASCLEALRWLVEQFPAGDDSADSSGAVGRCSDRAIFPHDRRPHCGEIAALYREALAVLGIDSRPVMLRKNVFDPHDSHVSVEAHLDGRWVLIDPTFNATFTDDAGQALGAQAIKSLLFKGQRQSITPQVHGRALCPLALDDYYVDVFACFNNVFIIHDPPAPALCKLPLLCYALGPQWHYEKLPDESAAHLNLWRHLYLAAALTVPTFALLSIAAVVALVAA